MPQGNSIQANGMGGSPSDIYLIFILQLAKDYFNGIADMNKTALDAKTAALIAFIPSGEVRRRIWENYVAMKDKNPGGVTASVYAVGDVMEYLAATLDLTKESTGSFL